MGILGEFSTKKSDTYLFNCKATWFWGVKTKRARTWRASARDSRVNHVILANRMRPTSPARENGRHTTLLSNRMESTFSQYDLCWIQVFFLGFNWLKRRNVLSIKMLPVNSVTDRQNDRDEILQVNLRFSFRFFMHLISDFNKTWLWVLLASRLSEIRMFFLGG